MIDSFRLQLSRFAEENFLLTLKLTFFFRLDINLSSGELRIIILKATFKFYIACVISNSGA